MLRLNSPGIGGEEWAESLFSCIAAAMSVTEGNSDGFISDFCSGGKANRNTLAVKMQPLYYAVLCNNF